MDKLYNKTTFVNNSTPALNATNLNGITQGLSDVDDRVIEMNDAIDTLNTIDSTEIDAIFGG